MIGKEWARRHQRVAGELRRMFEGMSFQLKIQHTSYKMQKTIQKKDVEGEFNMLEGR